MRILQSLEPNRVFYYFEEISKIPRGSKNTKEISDYLTLFAKEHRLKYDQDKTNNVIIYKAASPGYESVETVILQGHMDMVCEKNQNCSHDFEKEGIKLMLEGNRLFADGTTLGGDDGIALAYALAILESNEIKHPALEAVFTVDEEVGMDGAKALDAAKLKGRLILNIDSEEEGILWASCAGGLSCVCRLPLQYEISSQECEGFSLSVTGLLGGHSGTEIDKGRANANCLLGRILYMLRLKIDYRIAAISGGMKDNAIPREARAILTVPIEKERQAKEAVAEISEILKSEYRSKEPDLAIEWTKTKKPKWQMKEASRDQALFLLTALPNGVQEMSRDIEGLVETSLNIGVMSDDNQEFALALSVRSSIESAKEFLKEKVVEITKMAGGICEASGSYPAWEFRKDSKLREICSHAYKKLYGKEMSVQAMHAGLECGILSDKLKQADCVSFGPNIMEIHTPKEWMDIASVKRVYALLLQILSDFRPENNEKV